MEKQWTDWRACDTRALNVNIKYGVGKQHTLAAKESEIETEIEILEWNPNPNPNPISIWFSFRLLGRVRFAYGASHFMLWTMHVPSTFNTCCCLESSMIRHWFIFFLFAWNSNEDENESEQAREWAASNKVNMHINAQSNQHISFFISNTFAHCFPVYNSFAFVQRQSESLAEFIGIFPVCCCCHFFWVLYAHGAFGRCPLFVYIVWVCMLFGFTRAIFSHCVFVVDVPHAIGITSHQQKDKYECECRQPTND